MIGRACRGKFNRLYPKHQDQPGTFQIQTNQKHGTKKLSIFTVTSNWLILSYVKYSKKNNTNLNSNEKIATKKKHTANDTYLLSITTNLFLISCTICIVKV